MRAAFLLASVPLLSATAADATEREIPPAFGPHVHLSEADFVRGKSFRASDKIVGTYYFYWYDIESGAHIVDADGTDALTTHPASMEGFSFKSARWHRAQLEDMMAAGIDVVLPVFWGGPSEHEPGAHNHWSFAGLPPLVKAREELARAAGPGGRGPPRIGMFYDTSTLRFNSWNAHIDLTTDYGRRWFYATIRDFFSMIPPAHWAMIDGRPIVLLYSAAFARGHDQGVIGYCREQFAREFGGRSPWIAREVSWRVDADGTVAWGGTLGLKNPGIGSLGPGYDHSAVPGRTPLVVDREGGAFYERNWTRFLRRPSNFVMLETWNEFHEGTDIADSREYGRRFIELTRKYSDMFRGGETPPPPEGRYTESREVGILLASTNQPDGLRLVENADGVTRPTSADGRDARASEPVPGRIRYVYFAADDSFKAADAREYEVEIEYRDASAGQLGLEFDGSDRDAPFDGAYSRSPETIELSGSGAWATATFPLPGARLMNSQNAGADFRLVIDADDFAVRRVSLRRR